MTKRCYTVGPHGIAAAVETKNSPPDCFHNVSTVLKEIIIQTTNVLAKSRDVYFYRHGVHIKICFAVFYL